MSKVVGPCEPQKHDRVSPDQNDHASSPIVSLRRTTVKSKGAVGECGGTGRYPRRRPIDRAEMHGGVPGREEWS